MSSTATKTSVPSSDPDRSVERSRRRLFDSVLAASALLLAALAVPFVRGEIYTHDDLGALHIPLRAFYATCLERGEAFDWLPHLFGGMYVTGEGQTGAYHPWHYALYRGLPFATAFDVELLASYPFMLLGGLLFLRRRLGRADAALFGAMIFTFSGFNLLHFAHMNAVAVVAHLPWLLWAIDIALTARMGWRVIAAEAAISLLVASQALLGYPQYVWFTLLAALAYALYLTRFVGVRRRAWRWMALAAAIGVLLGGVQLLPSWDALDHAARRGADRGFFDWGSLAPLNIVQIVAPYLTRTRVVGQNTHELGLYCGAVPVVLATWLVVARRSRSGARLFGVAAVAFACVALLMSFGRYGLIYEFQGMLPLVGSFRFPSRVIVLVHLALAAAAAVALAELVRLAQSGERPARRELVAVWGTAVVAALVPLWAWLAWDRAMLAPLPLVLAGPLLVLLAAAAVTGLLRNARGAASLIVWLAAIDLGVYGLSYSVWPHAAKFDDYLASIATPPGEVGERFAGDLARFDEETLRTGDQSLLAGRERIDGYLGLEPQRELDYRHVAALRTAGVHWVARSKTSDAIAGLERHDARWLAVPEPLPRVRCVAKVAVDRQPRAALAGLPLAEIALVERPIEIEPGAPGRAAIMVERPGSLDVAVETPTKQLLVVADSYHHGWSATVDRTSASVVRANGDFLGIVVPAGRHDVALRFAPQSLRGGWALSLFGLIALAGVFGGRAAWNHRRNKRLGKD